MNIHKRKALISFDDRLYIKPMPILLHFRQWKGPSSFRFNCQWRFHRLNVSFLARWGGNRHQDQRERTHAHVIYAMLTTLRVCEKRISIEPELSSKAAWPLRKKSLDNMAPNSWHNFFWSGIINQLYRTRTGTGAREKEYVDENSSRRSNLMTLQHEAWPNFENYSAIGNERTIHFL